MKKGAGIGGREESIVASGRGSEARGDGGGKTKELGTIRFDAEVGGTLGAAITSVSIGGITLGCEVDAPSNVTLGFFGVEPARLLFFAPLPTAKAGRAGEC